MQHMENINEFNIDLAPLSYLQYMQHQGGISWMPLCGGILWIPLDRDCAGGTHWVPLLLIKATGEKSLVAFF